MGIEQEYQAVAGTRQKLSSDSLELNPEERLNADLKQTIRSKVPGWTKEKLRAATESHMNDFASKPECVKIYFQVHL